MKKQLGFTLIELMITVVIIVILAAIAYPSYQGALIESRRSVAKGDLLRLASALERYYTTHSKYSGFILPFTQSPVDGTSKYYDLSVAIPSAVKYTLTATPIAGSAQGSDSCGTLSYTQAEQKTASGGVGCW